MKSADVEKWDVDDVSNWLKENGYEAVIKTFQDQEIDGYALVRLTEDDLRKEPIRIQKLGLVKHLHGSIEALQPHSVHFSHHKGRRRQNISTITESTFTTTDSHHKHTLNHRKYSTNLKPEKFKALVAAIYAIVVLYICALTMTIVNDRVPDMEKYPPLPDLFLDNVPYMPWAFKCSEYIAMSLSAMLFVVILTHKHRFIIVRRFFSLGGTLYLLRSVCMLMTSLSVPCRYFECSRPVDSSWYSKMTQALEIVAGGGMSLNGVRYCGDYMFSGHTTTLTLVNIFLDEYSHKDYPIVKTLGWVLNLFGIFLIMAGHEHYSIDVFIAFYLTTRLFLYYHTLADNLSRLRFDENKVRVWFPLFSYFESEMNGSVPYEFEWPIPEFIMNRLASDTKAE